MEQSAIHHYLERYFEANECQILENKSGFLKVKLTVDVDKLLINRPFYWHYIEKIGGQPETKTLSLKTRQESSEEGEFIHFGSPRLHQIFESTKNLAGYTRLYQHVEETSGASSTPLSPWLGVNFKISYKSHLKKDEILSLGLHLINGTILGEFHERNLSVLHLTPKIPHYCYTLAPMIKPLSGLRRLEAIIAQKIQSQDHSWADRAMKRWEEDQQLLDQFYENPEIRDELYEHEKEAIKDQYEPSIQVDVINGGVFYLTDHF